MNKYVAMEKASNAKLSACSSGDCIMLGSVLFLATTANNSSENTYTSMTPEVQQLFWYAYHIRLQSTHPHPMPNS